MSRGNVNVSLRDGLYYVHYDSINLYRSVSDKEDIRMKKDIPAGQTGKYNLDLTVSQANYNAWLETFLTAMQKRYPSLKRVDRYEKRGQRLVLENSMFQVMIEDNEWSFAVELISNRKAKYQGLQKHLFGQFLKGMREILLQITETIYVRSGSWRAEPFTKQDEDRMQSHIEASRITFDPAVKATGGYNEDFKRAAPAVETV